ncbi:MAG TPA: sigma-70 family RNA polymerase sigma factor [Pseudonocardia sp.]|nr:sigma-70 family RNA polymerase sigma factor [Pseudonocardia sp.]
MSEQVLEHTVTELVEAAAAGDRRAWSEIVVRYGDLVRATVAGFRLQQADAADAIQNTWLRAVERIGTVRDPERLGGWLTTTAARECLAVLRRSRRELPVDTFAEQVVWGGVGPEARVLREERDRAMDAAVGQLPTRRRQLVDAIFRGPDADYAAVSQLTGMPVGSIGPTRGRALVELRGRMRRGGYGPEDLVA